MPGRVRGIARTAVVAGTATAVSGTCATALAEPVGGPRVRGRGLQPQPTYQPPPPAYQIAPADQDMASKLAQRKQLGGLRDAGVLSDAEIENEREKDPWRLTALADFDSHNREGYSWRPRLHNRT